MKQRLNHVVCLSLMRDAEATDGFKYTLYARIRLDSMFFAPLPPSVLESALKRWTAVVPAGDAWGGDPNRPGVCDRMLIGRWKAFSTDVYGWKAFRGNRSHLSGRVLVGETYQRAILEHAKVSFVRVKMAYATLSVDGKVRYAEHLSNSLDVYGPGLLRDYPTVCPCEALASTSSCEGNVSKRCIHHIQTMAMTAADPGFCKLSRLCKCCKPGTRITPSQEFADAVGRERARTHYVRGRHHGKVKKAQGIKK